MLHSLALPLAYELGIYVILARSITYQRVVETWNEWSWNCM